MKKKFKELKKYLNDNSLFLESKMNDAENIYGIGSIINSDSNQITFFKDIKFKNDIFITNAKACFIKEIYKNYLPNSCIPIIVEDPYLAYALCSNFFYSKQSEFKNIDIKNFDAQIGDFVTIKSDAIIKNNVTIEDNVTIGSNVTICENTRIKSGCVLSNCKIGNNSLIQSGTIIGDRGFGFILNDKIEIKHIGNVIIGNNVQIGSNCTIDRASLDSTIIEDNVRIDNLVQIAHNVIVGNHTVIAGQSGIAGSAIIGKNCVIGGQVGIAGHIKIGNSVTIAAKSGVTKNIKDNSVIAGFPAIDINTWKKSIIKQYKDIK